MKKSKLIFAVSVLSATMFAFTGYGKDNPARDPIPDDWTAVSTAAELDAVRNDLSGNYILMNDISLAEYGDSWKPIGDDAAPFTGKFDGNGYKITDLAINRPNEYCIGLFGAIKDGSVSNLGVEIAEGGIKGGLCAGGIAGSMESSTIIDCYSTGNVSSSDSFPNYHTHSGGIAGRIYNSSIIGCYSTGDIFSHSSSGGITGTVADNSTITNCYSTGDISSSTSFSYDIHSGGIAGTVTDNSTIANCYSTGDISSLSSHSSVGGIAGLADSGQTITDCAAINSEINSPEIFAGRIVGYNSDRTASNSFALETMTVTGTYLGCGASGISKTLAELQQQATYETGLGWDFSSVWKMPAGGSGFPILQWQK